MSRSFLGELSYMGGKTRAVPILDKFVPREVKSIVSPFCGGGAFELHCATRRNLPVLAFDADPMLITFWSALKNHRHEVVSTVLALRNQLHALAPEAQRSLYYQWWNVLRQ